MASDDPPATRQVTAQAIARQAIDATESASRCAACAALAPFATRPELTAIVLAVCVTVVWSHEPEDQAALGALLAKLALAAPARVDAFVRRYAQLMSRACVRTAVAELPARTELLAHHRRATKI